MIMLTFQKHVHGYDRYPAGRIEFCFENVALESDGELVVDGVTYRPMLVWDQDCLVMARDRVYAYVVVRIDSFGLASEATARELAGATA